ncbi:MAG: hypothetical protein PHH54_02235 [Candidatus Nanoarchaeia archaeon]|nr:hypothetical protein [Candidatus Nanoarchaeia archaeon]MDD5740780.1 hypothetical protein [Candidatus Nanoarchaeia archaeon]
MGLQEITDGIRQDLEQIGGLFNIHIHFNELNNYIEYKILNKAHHKLYSQMCCKLKKIVSNNNPNVIITCEPDENCVNYGDRLQRKIYFKLNKNITNIEEKEKVLSDAALCFKKILKEIIKYGTKK